LLAAEVTRVSAISSDGLAFSKALGNTPETLGCGHFAWFAVELYEGGEPIQIGEVPGKWLVGNVAISPDGKLLAFPYQDQNDEARSTLAVIPSDGGPPVKTFPDVRGFVQCSPNGCCIVRYKLRDAVQQLVEQPLAGGKPRDLARFSSGRSEAFNWSPDGKWLYIAHGDARSDAVLIKNFR
jgi:hypothetical protein